MDKDETQVEQSGSGSDSSPGDNAGSSRGSGTSNLRTGLFIAVLVLAGGVAAHSVLTNGGKTCGIGGLCGIKQADGAACSTTTPCSLDKTGCDSTKATSCPLETANSEGAKPACCPLEKADGDCEKAACPFEKKVCPKTGDACKVTDCCPSKTTAEPAPQPAPTTPAGGCCPGC